MNEFYIVVNAITGPSKNPCKHSCFESAADEAKRIAAISPGAKVYVMQTVGYAIKRDVDWRHAAPADAAPALGDEIPF